MDIPPELCLELLMAADFLDSECTLPNFDTLTNILSIKSGIDFTCIPRRWTDKYGRQGKAFRSLENMDEYNEHLLFVTTRNCAFLLFSSTYPI